MMLTVSVLTYWCVAVIALAKLAGPASSETEARGTAPSWLRRLTGSWAFALAEFAIGACLLPLGWPSLQRGAALLLFALVLGGLLLPKLWRGYECNCFGSLRNKSTGFQRTLSLAILAGTASIASAAILGDRATPPPWDERLWLLALVAMAPAPLYLLLQRFLPSHSLAPDRSPDPLPTLTREALLGIGKDGRPTRFGELGIQSGPVLVFGLHSDCQSCAAVLPDLARAVNAISELVPVVVCSNSLAYLDRFPGHRVASFHDECNSFMDAVGISSYPYSILVQVESLQVAPLVAKSFPSMVQLMATGLVWAHRQGRLA